MDRETHVKQSVAMLSVVHSALHAPDKFKLYLERLLEYRPQLHQDDIRAAAIHHVDHSDVMPTIAALIDTARRLGRDRQRAIATTLRENDGWRPQMRCKERTCRRQGCDTLVWLIADTPEPRQTYAVAQARLWCPECMSVQVIDRDPLSHAVRYWLNEEEVKDLEREGLEPVHKIGLGYHHMMELSGRMKGYQPPTGPAVPAFVIRQIEADAPDHVIPEADVIEQLGTIQ
jgi:hypothetical protein